MGCLELGPASRMVREMCMTLKPYNPINPNPDRFGNFWHFFLKNSSEYSRMKWGVGVDYQPCHRSWVNMCTLLKHGGRSARGNRHAGLRMRRRIGESGREGGGVGKGCATQHTGQHRTAPHRTAPHRTAQHSTAQHSTAQHSTAQHSTAQHSTAQNNSPTYSNKPQYTPTEPNARIMASAD